MEIFDNSVAIVRLNIASAYRATALYLLIANYAIHENNFFDLFKGESVWGGSIGYAYNSIVGPMNTNFGLSNRNNNLQFYLNLGYSF